MWCGTHMSCSPLWILTLLCRTLPPNTCETRMILDSMDGGKCREFATTLLVALRPTTRPSCTSSTPHHLCACRLPLYLSLLIVTNSNEYKVASWHSIKTKQRSVEIKHQKPTTRSVQAHIKTEVIRLMTVKQEMHQSGTAIRPKRHQYMYKRIGLEPVVTT
jgi:hypothetical protein